MTSVKHLELVSFKLCPYVQRTVITLKQKQIPYDITYIDLQNPPEWFHLISPLGQVPLLKVDNDVLFESSVIQDYVDEVSPPSLYPTDPLLKAKNRAWMAFVGEALHSFFMLRGAKEQAEFETIWNELKKKLRRLDEAHCGGSFFNGEDISMIDASTAPLLMRLDFIKQMTGLDALEDTPKLANWWQSLSQRPCVIHSVVPEFPSLFKGMFKASGSYLATQIKD
jgi:glutathione S-transferase